MGESVCVSRGAPKHHEPFEPRWNFILHTIKCSVIRFNRASWRSLLQVTACRDSPISEAPFGTLVVRAGSLKKTSPPSPVGRTSAHSRGIGRTRR